MAWGNPGLLWLFRCFKKKSQDFNVKSPSFKMLHLIHRRNDTMWAKEKAPESWILLETADLLTKTPLCSS